MDREPAAATAGSRDRAADRRARAATRHGERAAPAAPGPDGDRAAPAVAPGGGDDRRPREADADDAERNGSDFRDRDAASRGLRIASERGGESRARTERHIASPRADRAQ